jgi:uncharacterized protein DUF72
VKIFIGTSGWHYKHRLGGVFYPPGTKGAGMFEFYARHFNTVEINNSFYRLPAAKCAQIECDGALEVKNYSRKGAKAQRKTAKEATWSPAGFAPLRE